MKNFDLNAGGVVGAILGGVLTASWLFTMTGADQDNSARVGRLALFGLIGGALEGNFLWDRVRGRRSNDDDSELG